MLLELVIEFVQESEGITRIEKTLKWGDQAILQKAGTL
jgi:hypothetical protein